MVNRVNDNVNKIKLRGYRIEVEIQVRSVKDYVDHVVADVAFLVDALWIGF